MKTVTQILLTFVLNALWQGTLIVGFAALADWLLRRVAPRFRHYLWVVTLFACLIIPALSCLPLSGSGTAQRTALSPLGPIPVVTSRIITPGIEDATSRPVAAESQVRNRFLPSRSVPIPILIAFGLVGLYGLIVIWRLVSLLRAWRRTNQIVAGVFECAFPDWVQERIEQCRSEVGIKSVRVLCSNDIAIPITVGVFDRMVILPQRFAHDVSIDVLTSALGHEFQHIARHDYLLNLIYEFIYLPLSFHPAVAFTRRRIKHTRELCCDAAVTTKLVSAEVYARSLVKLIGSAPLLPLAPDTTIGMNESDILEVRIMALLKKSQLSLRRRTLLLIAAAVLLLTPCVVAAKFALTVNTQEPANIEARKKVEASQDLAQQEKTVVELNRQARELKEKLAQSPTAMRPEVERRLKEVEQNLVEYQRNLEQTREKELIARQSDATSADAIKFELMQKFQAAEQGDRRARKIQGVEARYTDDARAKGIEGKVVLRFTVDHDGIPQSIQVKQSLYPSLDQAAVEAVREWRFEPAMKNGEPVSMWMEAEINFHLYEDQQKKEEREAEERLKKELAAYPAAQSNGQEIKVRLGNEAGRRAEREAEEKRNAILADMAKITMDHAIQIATSKAPGKVTECSLVGEHWEGAAELAKPSLVLYHVIILSEDATPTRTHVLVNALDGSIFRVNKEERREEEMTASAYTSERTATKRSINGGVLNGKAASLPVPEYPAIARATHASGAVNVQILIDEGGNVIEATAVSGHPLLRAAAQAAAKEAKFTTTRLNGEPVRVSGVLVFNFVEQ